MSSTPPLLRAEVFRYFLKVGYVARIQVRNENNFISFVKNRLLGQYINDLLSAFSSLYTFTFIYKFPDN